MSARTSFDAFRARLRSALGCAAEPAWLVVFALSIAFRLPSLVNAAGTNSDAAVVGLQAMHLLKGEWSPFLWGSGYQTSVDAMVAAAAFVFTGPSPLVLMLTTLGGHVVLTLLAYATLRRRFPAWTAAALCLPLVFTPDPVHTYVLYPPRQASLTIAFVALFLVDGAPKAKRPLLSFAAGGAVASLAVYADPYALLFLPIVAALGFLALFDDGAANNRRASLRKLGALAGGAALGIVPYQLLIHSEKASRGQTSLKLEVWRHNLELLWNDCLPWLLSTKVYAAQHMSDYAPVPTSGPYHGFQIVSALLLTAGVLSAFPLAFVVRIPWTVRRLGLVGALMVPAAIGGFLLSPMVMDHFSSRYLASILLLAPFALAPITHLLGGRRFLAAMAPYLVSAAVSGWLSYAPFGLTRHPSLDVDQKLGAALRERGIHYAFAHYWASYRLTFEFREDPIVVPTPLAEDRYPPYQAAFEREPVVAYIHDAYRSRGGPEQFELELRRGEWPFEPTFDRFEVGTFTVFILRRRTVERLAHREE